MVAQFLIGALSKAHGPDDIPPLLADDPSDPFAINSDPFSVLNLACEQQRLAALERESNSTVTPSHRTSRSAQFWLASSLKR